MTAPTQLWSPGRRDGDADSGAPRPGVAATPGSVGTDRRRVAAHPCPPSRAGGLARSRPPVRGIELAPCPVAPSRRPLALLTVVVVTFAVVCGLALLGQAAASRSEVPQETSVVRVGAGETVWDVAERVAPGSDVRAVVARIRELNGMTDSAVEPGVPLRVPARR